MMPSCTPTPLYSSDGAQSHSFSPSRLDRKHSNTPHIPGPHGDGKDHSMSLQDPFDPLAKGSKSRQLLDFNPLKPFGGLDELSNDSISAVENSQSKKKGSSGGFLPKRYSLDDMSSYDFGISKTNDSFSVQFRLGSDTEGSEWDQTNQSNYRLPFNKHNNSHSDTSKARFDFGERTNDSLDIVFEDSGCAEKNSDDILLDKMEEASGHLSQTADSSWMENDGVRSRHSRSRSEPQQVLNMIVENERRRSASPPSSKQSSTPHVLSSSQSRPTSLDLKDSNLKPKPTPVSKLYLYIQMQLCRRESLKDWLSSNTLGRDRHQLLYIFDQIVCAVDYIHENGMMHRDLKVSQLHISCTESHK